MAFIDSQMHRMHCICNYYILFLSFFIILNKTIYLFIRLGQQFRFVNGHPFIEGIPKGSVRDTI